MHNAFLKKGIPWHLNEKESPFFIIGSGRCGTTLLRRVLTSVEGIHIPPENWALHDLCWRFEKYRMLEDWDTSVDIAAIAHFESTQGWFKEIPEQFIRIAKKCPKKDQSIYWLLDSLYRYHSKLKDIQCTRWGDKTPLNVNLLPYLIDIFPDAKFIHLLRDGVDVVHSWKKQGHYGDDVIKPAQRWYKSVTTANNFIEKYPDKFLQIRYENLVQNPQIVTEEVCNYLSISLPDNILKVEQSSVTDDLKKHEHYKNALKPITNDFVGKGRRLLSKEEKVKIKPIINDLLKEYEYLPLQ